MTDRMPRGNCERCMHISWRREPNGETSPGYSRIVEAYRCDECGREFVTIDEVEQLRAKLAAVLRDPMYKQGLECAAKIAETSGRMRTNAFIAAAIRAEIKPKPRVELLIVERGETPTEFLKRIKEAAGKGGQ